MRVRLNLGRQIALGLAAAHAQGLLHRDIKPANIWLEQSEDGEVIAKVLDFGLARSVDGDGSLTQSGMIVGTPQYMAPEQARDATPNVRSDLFSLGCVLYQMTTGRQPFVGRNVLDQLRALAVDVPPQVSELRDNAPSELSQLIHQLLEKTPSSRPASVTEVAERLREIATPKLPPRHVDHWSWQRWTLVAIAVTVVLSVAGIALRENRPAGDGTQSISPTTATVQPLVTKPEASDSTPRDKPAIDSVDLPSSKPKLDGLANERARDVLKASDVKKAADVKRFDVQLFWTGNEKQEKISVKTAFLDGREPTTILDFQKRWGINDFADIAIDENTRRIYLGLPREENRDARIVSFDYDGHQLREELQSNFVWSMCVDESRQRLYVSGAGPSGIFSVPLSGNGADRHQFTIPKTFYANGLTVDPIEQKVYWVDPGPGVRTGGKLQRSNLEGTIVENVMTGLLEPTGLALDPIEKTIYWVEGYPPRVRSVNYDGSNAKTLIAGESKNREDNYWDIAFDKPSGKLYFISRAAISRCDRDGSNLEHMFAPGGDCLKIARATSSPEPSSTAEKPATEKTMPVEASKIRLDRGPVVFISGEEFAATQAPRLAINRDGSGVIVWQGKRKSASGWDVFARGFSDTGSIAVRVTSLCNNCENDQALPNIAALSNGNFITVWQSQGEDGSDWAVVMRMLTAKGEPFGNQSVVNAYTDLYQTAPAVAANSDGRFLVTWNSIYQVSRKDGWDVFSQVFNNDGTRVGTEFCINGATIGNQMDPAAVFIPNGSFLISFKDGKGDIFAQRFNQTAAKIGTEFMVNAKPHWHMHWGKGASRIATNGDDRLVVVWQNAHPQPPQDGSFLGVFAQVFDLEGNRIGNEIRVNEQSKDFEFQPSVSMLPSGEFFVVWIGPSNGNQKSLFGRLFTKEGQTLSAELRLNEVTTSDQTTSDVAATSKGTHFVVTWNGDGPNNEKGVFAKWIDVFQLK